MTWGEHDKTGLSSTQYIEGPRLKRLASAVVSSGVYPFLLFRPGPLHPAKIRWTGWLLLWRNGCYWFLTESCTSTNSAEIPGLNDLGYDSANRALLHIEVALGLVTELELILEAANE